MIDPDTPENLRRKAYRKVSDEAVYGPPPMYIGVLQLSFLVHPDKNPEDRERAQKAFEGTQVSGCVMNGVAK